MGQVTCLCMTRGVDRGVDQGVDEEERQQHTVNSVSAGPWVETAMQPQPAAAALAPAPARMTDVQCAHSTRRLVTKLLTSKRRRDASGVAFIGLGAQLAQHKKGPLLQHTTEQAPSPQHAKHDKRQPDKNPSVDDIFAQLLG